MKLRRGLIIFAWIAGAALVLWSLVPEISGPGISGVVSKAMNEAKQVGLAAVLYANDHGGRLPKKLEEVVPTYLPDGALFSHMELTTPGVLMKDLPPEAIIAIKIATDGKGKETRVVLVRLDGSLELRRP